MLRVASLVRPVRALLLTIETIRKTNILHKVPRVPGYGKFLESEKGDEKVSFLPIINKKEKKKPSSQIGRRPKCHRYTTYSVRRLSPFILPSCNGKVPARSTGSAFDLQLKSDFPSIRYSHPASTVPDSLCLSADVYSLSQRLFVL